MEVDIHKRIYVGHDCNSAPQEGDCYAREGCKTKVKFEAKACLLIIVDSSYLPPRRHASLAISINWRNQFRDPKRRIIVFELSQHRPGDIT